MKTLLCLILCGAALVSVSDAAAKESLAIKPLTERRVTQLPQDELYWRVETFATADAATAAAGPFSLAATAAGKAWLFTLGPAGGHSANAVATVAEIGPIPRFDAQTYLLRINLAEGPPGSETPIHTHPGSEAFYVLEGEHGILSPRGQIIVSAGQGEPGRGAYVPMLVSSKGRVPLRSLVMFVVDADKPFSEPACFPEDAPAAGK